MRVRGWIAGLMGALFGSAGFSAADVDTQIGISSPLDTAAVVADVDADGDADDEDEWRSTLQDDLLATFAEQIEERLGEAASVPLGEMLASLGDLDRTRTLMSWTLSDCQALRRAVARVGSGELRAVGLDSAIEHLTNDADPAVRKAARQALARRVARAQRVVR